jgi:hypothetical protein
MAISPPPVNLRKLLSTRRKPRPGDVFCMQLPDGRFLFGRVILADLAMGRAPMPGANLIYIYRCYSVDKVPDMASMTSRNLLLHPIFTNRMAWTRGYFEFLFNQPLQPNDLLRAHCFRRWDGVYVDESGDPIGTQLEPCGDWGLSSYLRIDDLLSDVHGYPQAGQPASSLVAENIDVAEEH